MAEESRTPRNDALTADMAGKSDADHLIALDDLSRVMLAALLGGAERERDQAIERMRILEIALTDALEMLNGWINRYCAPKYRSEHLAHLDRLHAALAPAAINTQPMGGEG